MLIGQNEVAARERCEIIDLTDVGTETLEDGDFAAYTEWGITGDFAEGGVNENYVYTHNTGIGALTQVLADLNIPPSPPI